MWLQLHAQLIVFDYLTLHPDTDTRVANTLLTHWGRVMHICVNELPITGSDNGLSPGRRQAFIWTNAGILLIRTLGINFSEILSEIHTLSFNKMYLKMSSGKRRLFCLGLNLITEMVGSGGLASGKTSWLSGVPDFFDRNKILSGGDLSHYQVPHCIRIFFHFVWFVFIHHNLQFYFELCTYCNILDIYLSWNLNFVNYLLFYMKLLNYLFFNMFGSVLGCCELTGVSLLWPWLIKWK